jgi:hypothetical protein
MELNQILGKQSVIQHYSVTFHERDKSSCMVHKLLPTSGSLYAVKTAANTRNVDIVG